MGVFTGTIMFVCQIVSLLSIHIIDVTFETSTMCGMSAFISVY